MSQTKDISTYQAKKTRIAPTPSGFLHLGNVLSFALTAGIAAKTKAKVLLRIDDLDRERANPRYVQDIFDTLDFLGISWDEGPASFREYRSEYSQLYRLDMYREALEQLRENGQIFACTCSRSAIFRKGGAGGYPGTCRNKEIPPAAGGTSWRLRTSPAEVIRINTLGNGTVTGSLPPSMQDFIVRRKDGLPSYQLTSLVDDMYYGIDLIVRGEDLWDSTLAQLSLASLLQLKPFGEAVFHHHPLLKDPGGNKLSKSAGAVSVQYLRRQGKKPAEIYSLIGSMLQARNPVKDWQSLAKAVSQPV
ncbi:MAG TPA: glutamate--tRNA ligase family protein [Anseongella sp.]|nr:glutamate--tRNA ligase family protein [Anseongella sp.]